MPTTTNTPQVGDLRVWWIPQIGMQGMFEVLVSSVEEGAKLMVTLAEYDLFQFENRIKPDYWRRNYTPNQHTEITAMKPYGEFPLSFDLHKNGKLLSSHSVRDNDEEKIVTLTAENLYPGQITKVNRFDARYDCTPDQSIPEIKALKLCTVYCDGSTTLVSLTHKTVLFDNDEGEKSYPDIPHVYLTEQDENTASDEWFGTEDGHADGDGFPGWPAIFHYLNKHPERLQPGSNDKAIAEANDDQ